MNKSALLVIDVQAGDFQNNSMYNSEKLLSNISQLITWAHINKVPVILTQHNGKLETPTSITSPGWLLHPSLPITDLDMKIEKNFPDSFQGTNLEAQLLQLEVKRLIVVGIRTEICVDATCRKAFSLGFDIVLVKDGHSTTDSAYLGAEQIILHHNTLLEEWFVSLRDTKQVINNEG
ncbi:isochorismatase family protein [Paenibacillus illinoisensis]|uniref:isochorismatase family protein n=1 Tax=Paenibacillus illinoisensis TaxID=59845 RepID=UPI00301C26E1